MTKTHFRFLYLLLITLSFSACSVEKRVHQDGYHVSWKHRHAVPSEKPSVQIVQNKIESPEIVALEKPNEHSVELISASASTPEELITSKPNSTFSFKSVSAAQDTVVPKQESQHEEYFSNSYTPPAGNNDLDDTKLANWALGLGIGAISSPLIITLTTLLIFTILGASWANASFWIALGLAVIIGGGIFITLEILAITFAIRFLRKHGKDPNYRKYRSRAITGLILAGIYPALMLINLILAIALGI